MTEPDESPQPATAAQSSLRSWVAWRDLLLRSGVGLLTIFVGVTAAFFADAYREKRDQDQQLAESRAGVITELRHYESRGGEIADEIDRSIANWKSANAAGRQVVPAYYLFKVAPRPPVAAWTSAMASGTASRFDPELQLELGYFYSEYSGIHENYARQLDFTENEILPRKLIGPAAFYDANGKLQPQFAVHVNLLARFNADLRRLNAEATRLRIKLEGQAGDQR